MNPTNKILLGVCTLATAGILAGCVVRPYGGVDVYAPAPEVRVAVYPDSYVWDGYEYVGVVGGSYYYLGPNHVWVVCEPFRAARFHEWERYHPDWHYHATHNERYRGGNERHEDRDYPRDHNRRDRDRR